MYKAAGSAINELNPKQYFYAVGFVLALLFAMLDPNPAELSSAELLLLWLFQGVLPVFLLMLCQDYMGRIKYIHHGSPWLKLVLSGILASGLFAGPALFIDIMFGLDPLYHNQAEWLLAWWQEMLAIAPPVTLGWLAANAPWLLGWQLTRVSSNATLPEQQPAATSATENKAAFVAFLQQLPADKRGNLLYLKAELHYLLVVTDRGSSLILSSLKDAIGDLPPGSGIQPHRSFWVPKTAIKTMTRQGRQGQLQLTDGSKIPVSRQQLPAVQLILSVAE